MINFTQELECQFCRETRQLLTEVSQLVDVSKGKTDLRPETKQELRKIDQKVHLQVSAVPRTIINENLSVEGVVPEEKNLVEIMRAIQKTV